MKALSTVSTSAALAGTFAAMRALGIADRRLFDEILRETLAQNTQYFGVWSVWEPNALDGRDEEYANAPGHDGTGRFISLWNRAGGAIHVEPNLGYDVPGYGDWYRVPMQRGCETVMDPYEFPFAGQDEFITSQVAPIFFQGKCVGAAGVDIAINELPKAEGTLLEESLRRGYIFLDTRGAVRYWSLRTRELLQSFTEEAVTEALPGSLTRQLSEVMTKRRPREQVLRARNRALRSRLLPQPDDQGYLVIIEEVPGNNGGHLLTTREQEVLIWIQQGKSNTEIAIILGISPHTTKRHVERILAKLGVENRYAAALSGLEAFA